MTDMREEFERIAKETHQIINFSRYEDALAAAEYGREIGDYCVPFLRDLWQGYQMAIAARTGGEAEASGNWESELDEAIQDYEFTDGDGYYYNPNDTERCLIKDFIMGCELLNTHPAPAAAVPDGFCLDAGHRAYYAESGKKCSCPKYVRHPGCTKTEMRINLPKHNPWITTTPQPVGEGEPETKPDNSNLIFVGFTNPYQIRYAKDESGSFYPDTDNECYIPLYMLKNHEHRLYLGEAQPPEGER